MFPNIFSYTFLEVIKKRLFLRKWLFTDTVSAYKTYARYTVSAYKTYAGDTVSAYKIYARDTLSVFKDVFLSIFRCIKHLNAP